MCLYVCSIEFTISTYNELEMTLSIMCDCYYDSWISLSGLKSYFFMVPLSWFGTLHHMDSIKLVWNLISFMVLFGWSITQQLVDSIELVWSPSSSMVQLRWSEPYIL